MFKDWGTGASVTNATVRFEDGAEGSLEIEARVHQPLVWITLIARVLPVCHEFGLSAGTSGTIETLRASVSVDRDGSVVTAWISKADFEALAAHSLRGMLCSREFVLAEEDLEIVRKLAARTRSP